MAYSFNAFCIFTFLLFQTSVAPKLGIMGELFDLMIVFIVYEAVYRPIKEGFVFIILMGILTDSMSSSPFGLYLTLYFWLFISIRWILKYLHAGNFVLIPFIFVGAIIAENLLIAAVMAVFDKTFHSIPEIFQLTMRQLMWGLVFGPMLIWFIKNLHFKWETQFFEKVFKHFR
jgi:rod shape-determining protein MreD